MRELSLKLVNNCTRSIQCISDKLLFKTGSVDALPCAFPHFGLPPVLCPTGHTGQHFRIEGTLKLLSGVAWRIVRDVDLEYRSGVRWGVGSFTFVGSVDRAGIY